MKSSAIALILLALLVGIGCGVGGYAFIYAKGYSYLLNDPAACSNCHAMRIQYEAWMKSSHHSAATCNDCHMPHNLVGKYAVKQRAEDIQDRFFNLRNNALDALVDLINGHQRQQRQSHA